MTQKNSKRALVLSVLSIVLCAAMLIGTTFAWFTDNASTNVTSIEAGTIKVDLVNKEGDSLVREHLNFVKAEGAESEAILWEPGATYNLPEVYVKNNGNLALKYKLIVSGIDGDAKLLEAIDWKITVGGVETDLADFEGHLSAGEKSTGALMLSGHMKESAGNEFQGLTANGIAITVVATQDTVEYDSFGDNYDAGASFLPCVAVTEGVNNVSGKMTIADDLTLLATQSLNVSASSALNLEGKTITIEFRGGNARAIDLKESGATLSNGNIVMTGSGIAITAFAKNTVIESITGENVLIITAQNSDTELTIKDCTLNGDKTLITVQPGTTVNLINCTVSGKIINSGTINTQNSTINGKNMEASYTEFQMIQ